MEQVNDQLEVQTTKYRLGKIKSKYLIILIVCGSDHLENCVPQFSKSCKTFQKLYQQQGIIFARNGLSNWKFLAIPKEPDSLIKTEEHIRLIYLGLQKKRFKLEKIFDINSDGNHPKNFHKNCEGVPHTLCILQTDYNQIIGGYTRETWDISDKEDIYKADETAFIFSLTRMSIYPIKKGRE